MKEEKRKGKDMFTRKVLVCQALISVLHCTPWTISIRCGAYRHTYYEILHYTLYILLRRVVEILDCLGEHSAFPFASSMTSGSKLSVPQLLTYEMG